MVATQKAFPKRCLCFENAVSEPLKGVFTPQRNLLTDAFWEMPFDCIHVALPVRSQASCSYGNREHPRAV